MSVLRSLPTLSDLQRTRRTNTVPSRLEAKAQQATVDRKAEGRFLAAVWRRDEGRCRLCGRRVRRTLTLCPEQGHVHHLKGRRVAPADRFNPNAAVLLCATCHRRHHAGVLKVPA